MKLSLVKNSCFRITVMCHAVVLQSMTDCMYNGDPEANNGASDITPIVTSQRNEIHVCVDARTEKLKACVLPVEQNDSNTIMDITQYFIRV